jgi:hypothetical protein
MVLVSSPSHPRSRAASPACGARKPFSHRDTQASDDKARNRALYCGRVVGFVVRLLGLGTTTGVGAVTGVISAVIASHSSAVRSRAINCSGTEINAISFV